MRVMPFHVCGKDKVSENCKSKSSQPKSVRVRVSGGVAKLHSCEKEDACVLVFTTTFLQKFFYAELACLHSPKIS